MARAKKSKTVRAIKSKKPRFKKVKNSFLQIGKTYNFETEIYNKTSTFYGVLLGVNETELLIESLIQNTEMKEKIILNRKNMSSIKEELKSE